MNDEFKQDKQAKAVTKIIYGNLMKVKVIQFSILLNSHFTFKETKNDLIVKQC
jgi:hypothetical protein